jgi:hypothetical protein
MNGLGVVHIWVLFSYESIDHAWIQRGNVINSLFNINAFGSSVTLSDDGDILAGGEPG